MQQMKGTFFANYVKNPAKMWTRFVLQLRKQVRNCGYGVEEVEFSVRDQLLEKVLSQELLTSY